jgi:hypothetical protein
MMPESEAPPGILLIGIHSQELQTTRYNLEVTHNGQILQKWLDISLTPGKEWQQSISTPPGQGLAEAILYLADDPGVVYRRVSIMVND